MQVCQVERLESNLDCDAQACLDWEHLLPWPLIFTLTSPEAGIHNGIRHREDRELWLRLHRQSLSSLPGEQACVPSLRAEQP